MRRFAYWLFPLIAVAVAIFIVVFMIQINTGVPMLNGFSAKETDGESEISTEENVGWLEHFSLGGEKGYLYPVNELTLKLDANESYSE